jgi:sodium transport system permease protein
MRFTILKAIYKKELLDVIRDRRALISMVVVPLVVFPILIGGIARLIPQIQKRAEQEAGSLTVAVKTSTPAIREALEKAGMRVRESGDVKAAVQNKSAGAGVEESAGSPPRISVYVDA